MKTTIANRFLKCLGSHLLFLELLLVTTINAAKKQRDYSPAIYYGDSDVNIGSPFSITCIISISDPIEWLKDGETITKHNLRHGKDVHSYSKSEHVIEGENDKVEARLSVQHALQTHEGKYQCNSLHTSYHYLRVHKDNSNISNNKHGIIDLNRNIPATMYNSFRPLPPLPSDINLTAISTRTRTSTTPSSTAASVTSHSSNNLNRHNISPNNNNIYIIDQQQLETNLPLSSSSSPPYYYQPARPELTTNRNMMRNYGNIHTHHKTTDLFFDNPETDITSVGDFGISLKPFITTASPKRYESDDILDPTNLFISKSPSQSSSSSLPSQQNRATTKLLLQPVSTSSTYKLDDFVSIVPVTTISDPNRKETVKPSSNNVPVVVYTINKNLTLSCDTAKSSGGQIERWERNNTNVNEDEKLTGRFKLSDYKFTIDKANVNDSGTYSCIVKGGSFEGRQDFKAHAQVEVRVPSNLGVVEGESLIIPCTVVGTHPYITWEYGNITISNSTDHYILKENNDVENALLQIVNATLDDRGEYKCIGRNYGAEVGKRAEDTSFVRVKGKLAALWPFLGICAEVFILCAIILIYEKKRNKTDLDESDTDPNTEQEKLKTQRN